MLGLIPKYAHGLRYRGLGLQYMNLAAGGPDRIQPITVGMLAGFRISDRHGKQPQDRQRFVFRSHFCPLFGLTGIPRLYCPHSRTQADRADIHVENTDGRWKKSCGKFRTDSSDFCTF